MNLNGDQAAQVRRKAQALLKSVLPYKDDGNFKVVCKDYGGLGTTCGFLCHWLLWRLGVSDQNKVNPKSFHGRAKTIINRSEPGFTYMPGENLSRLVENPFYVRAYGTHVLQSGKRPGTGDIVYIHEEPNGPQNTEHVFVFVEEKDGTWITAESGQEYGRWGKFRDDRQLIQSQFIKITGNNPFRSIMGWLPIDQLDYRSAP